jgi:hypothetical protein
MLKEAIKQLQQAILQLEINYATGELPEETYMAKIEQYRQKLKELEARSPIPDAC